MQAQVHQCFVWRHTVRMKSLIVILGAMDPQDYNKAWGLDSKFTCIYDKSSSRLVLSTVLSKSLTDNLNKAKGRAKLLMMMMKHTFWYWMTHWNSAPPLKNPCYTLLTELQVLWSSWIDWFDNCSGNSMREAILWWVFPVNQTACTLCLTPSMLHPCLYLFGFQHTLCLHTTLPINMSTGCHLHRVKCTIGKALPSLKSSECKQDIHSEIYVYRSITAPF